LSQHRRALQLLVGQVLRLQRVLQRLAALLLGLLPRLTREPLADLVARPRRLREREPVARRAAAGLRGEDLDEVAVPELVVQWNDSPVHLCADGAVPGVR